MGFLGVKCFPSHRSIISKSPDPISFAINVLVVGLLSDKDENVVEIKQVESQQKNYPSNHIQTGKVNRCELSQYYILKP